jgi:hypothetical protein
LVTVFPTDFVRGSSSDAHALVEVRDMPSRFVLLAALVITVMMPTAARAQGYFSPGIGIAFGSPTARGLADFVADIGWLSAQPVGLELDFTYAPSYFGNEGSYGANSVTTVMGNVIVAAGQGGGRYGRSRRRRSSARPYISGGLGLIHEETAAPAIARNDFGANLGVGVMATASGQVGVRGDLRYFRDLVGKSTGDTTTIDFGSFHFWRASLTVLFRF